MAAGREAFPHRAETCPPRVRPAPRARQPPPPPRKPQPHPQPPHPLSVPPPWVTSRRPWMGVSPRKYTKKPVNSTPAKSQTWARQVSMLPRRPVHRSALLLLLLLTSLHSNPVRSHAGCCSVLAGAAVGLGRVATNCSSGRAGAAPLNCEGPPSPDCSCCGHCAEPARCHTILGCDALLGG